MHGHDFKSAVTLGQLDNIQDIHNNTGVQGVNNPQTPADILDIALVEACTQILALGLFCPVVNEKLVTQMIDGALSCCLQV